MNDEVFRSMLGDGPFANAGEVRGSFTTTFSHNVAELLAHSQPPTATVSMLFRPRWWRRLWLWLRRRPTSKQVVIHNAQFTPLRLAQDGTVSAEFTGRAADVG